MDDALSQLQDHSKGRHGLLHLQVPSAQAKQLTQRKIPPTDSGPGGSGSSGRASPAPSGARAWS